MAPLPFNSTSILFVDYSTTVNDHTLLCRFDGDSTGEIAMGVVDDFFGALSPQLGDILILGARVQLIDTNVSFDVAWTGAVGYGDGSQTPASDAIFVDFVGRTITGRRARAAVFGTKTLTGGDNYRAVPGEVAAFDAARAVLEGTTDSFLGIDGNAPIWKQYANTGVNAYWRNHNR